MRSDIRWLLFITAIIGVVGYANAVKATSLIFGRIPSANKTAAFTTTTTTTVATIDGESPDDEAKAGETGDEDNVTKPPLTGIPQIDYVWDPNLPRELNGFNLSTYPFLNSVPSNEDIDFKCDGLHDGFYASIKYSCQLYHHCVYGIRHDFLCANFTAFDQKSFICHFVSEVNCKSSAKYWFRNDALYQATTTTSTTTTTQAPPSTTTTLAPERPLRKQRRPLRRRRPTEYYAYDDDEYDDDYVEERMNRRRKPNRNRNRRPEYDDYDNPPRSNFKDDEDDYSFEQQRPAHRHRTRTRDEEDDYEYDHRGGSYDRPRNRKHPENKRHSDDDRRYDDSEERRPQTDGKRKHIDRKQPTNDEKGTHDDRRSLNGDERMPSDDRKTATQDDRRKATDDRRSIGEDRRGVAEDGRRNHYEKRRRPQQHDDDYEEHPKKPNTRNESDIEDRSPKRPNVHGSKSEIIPKVRSSSATASIFNRPRAPPKINRPVPNTEKKKYEYAPSKPEKTTTPAPEEELYDDEYDYESEKMMQPETRPDTMDIKKSNYNQREQRPAIPPSGPPSHRTEAKEKGLLPYDAAEDESYEPKSKAPPKPQRATTPKQEHISNAKPPQQQQQQQQKLPSQRPVKSEYYDADSKEIATKSNPKHTIDFNKDEYIPESESIEYADEELDDRSEVPPQPQVQPQPQPQQQLTPIRNEYRSNTREQVRTTAKYTGPKQLNEQEQLPKSSPQPDALQYKTKFHRLSPPSAPANTRIPDTANFPKTNTEPEERDVYTILMKETVPVIREPSGFKPVGYATEPSDIELESGKNRPYVRVMKRPFLPSRGGSPYLPRGLKPVGTGITLPEYSTENARLGPNPAGIPNIHLEYGPNIPLNTRTNINNPYGITSHPHTHTHSQLMDLRTTTQLPQIESPRSPLDEIYNNDYDVTLNDALNPTLKPLSQSHETAAYINKYDRANPYARADVHSDVSQSSSQHRSTAIPIQMRQSAVQPPQLQQQPKLQQQPQHQQPTQPQQQQQQQEEQPQRQSQVYYDEYEY